MRFCRFQLRTSDVGAAREFYDALLGENRAEIVPLPAEVAARGAPPHWLGQIGVEDVEAAAQRFVQGGAMRLGPTRATPDGGALAIVRDPGQAVVALATAPASVRDTGVAWDQLYSTDVPRAIAAYREAFGWVATEPPELGELGTHQQLAWQPGGAVVGTISDTTVRPGIHPHWLFYFRIPALEPALAFIRDAGGTVIGPQQLPSGRRVAACEDAQRAAFGLIEDGPPAPPA
jgi:predicted enzyme related to lactoylglutathione lyase